MKKNYIRYFSVLLGILFFIFLVANFGLNIWLKYRLPDFIKNNSDYAISYESLDVHLGTGNIFATGITVNNKNPENQNVIGLQGTIDTLSVTQLGIFDVVFNKRISTSDLVLKKPSLNVILAKPINDKTRRKRNPFVFENLTVNGGAIHIFKHTKQKFLSVKSLNLHVENLQMTEESVEKKLPVVFDNYAISGENFYFRPDNLYAVTAKSVDTKEKQMSLKNFAVVPLISQRDLIRFYPKKNNLFSFKASEIDLRDIMLKDHKISLADARFQNPELVIYTADAKNKTKTKALDFDINLENILVNNLNISILKPNGNPLLTGKKIYSNIRRFVMNGESTKNNIPFEYSDFKFSGQQIGYSTNTENVKISELSVSPKSLMLQNFSVKPTGVNTGKPVVDLTGNKINFKINEWKFVNNKLKLDIQAVSVNQLNGKIVAAKNPDKKKAGFNGIVFPMNVKNLEVKNSNLIFDKGNSPIVLEDLNGNFKNIQINASTLKESLPFKTGSYAVTTRNFRYRTKFYNLSAAQLKFSKNSMLISGFAVKPTVSRAEFIRMIPTEKDLYDLKVNQIAVNGSWDFISSNKFLNASQVTVDGVNANIFRSKIPQDDVTEKPLYSKLLRSVKFPLYIQNLDVRNSVLEYEEDTKKSDGPGKLTFNNFNMNVKNLNSGKMNGKPTVVPINLNCRFMNASPMNVKWSFDTANISDAFFISGNIADLPASRINPFIEPYLKIRATGLISDLIFSFRGNNNGLNGSLNMKHQDLKVSVLKETGEKNKLLSAVVNVFVRTNSGNYPESVAVEDVQRDKTKSFFNLFWRGIEHGLKKTLIGKNAVKTEISIKKTVKNTKSAIEENKKDIQETKQNIREKGGLRNVFRKKSEK